MEKKFDTTFLSTGPMHPDSELRAQMGQVYLMPGGIVYCSTSATASSSDPLTYHSRPTSEWQYVGHCAYCSSKTFSPAYPRKCDRCGGSFTQVTRQ